MITPPASPDATYMPDGEHLATVTSLACSVKSSALSGSAMLRITTLRPLPYSRLPPFSSTAITVDCPRVVDGAGAKMAS